jgi:hypothetical protein
MHRPPRARFSMITVARSTLATLATVAALAGCSRTDEQPSRTTITTEPSATKIAAPVASASAPSSAAPTAAASDAKPTPITPITWTDPPTWTKQPPANEMRIAQYKVPEVAGDAGLAECVVSRFGGGSVNENVDRWIRQFDPATTQPFKKATKDVGGMHVTTLDIAGSYKGLMMQTAVAPQPKAGWRMVGAIVEAPGALWFFKMTGPDKTVKAATPAFDKMIDSLKK